MVSFAQLLFQMDDPEIQIRIALQVHHLFLWIILDSKYTGP